MANSLPEAFGLIAPTALVAIVGGGGKTSLMFALAKALPGRVVMTTTTRIFAAQMRLATAVTQYPRPQNSHDSFATDLTHKLAEFGNCLVVGEVIAEKAHGVPQDLPGQLLARPDVDFVLVEADGSRTRPIKAPADHEPVIPPQTTLVIPVVGINALGQTIDTIAHRPKHVAQLLGISPEATAVHTLSTHDVAALLTHPQGALKNVPADARVIPLLNKVETADQRRQARKIARLALQEPRLEHVVLGAVRTAQPVGEVQRRVTAVILAAGESKRMGRTKQLLPWGATTILGQVLRNLKETAVHDIIVISGHQAVQIEAIAATENVNTRRNTQYASGEMLSSLQTAVAALPAHINAVLVMLADQPQIPPQVIDKLLIAYWQGQGQLLAPSFNEQRGNPVLIDRAHFAALLALPVGAAPRDLLRQHPVHLVPVETDAILLDLDEWERYVAQRP